MPVFPEQQIWTSALAAEHDHADGSEQFALRRAGEAVAEGDPRLAAFWEAVAARLRLLHRIGLALSPGRGQSPKG